MLNRQINGIGQPYERENRGNRVELGACTTRSALGGFRPGLRPQVF
jgi:hypothetical protein